MRWFDPLPFRIGTTSYIVPADILPNARWLAEKVKDIELVLFDVDEYCNVPDAETIAELNTIAATYGLTYTVHLPLDLDFGANGKTLSVEKAQKVIRATEDLFPWAYVAHLAKGADGKCAEEWQKDRTPAIRELLFSVSEPSLLAVENLECYPAEWNLPIINENGLSMTIDIGHLWLQGRDPLPLLSEWLPFIRVIHLHGIGTRDHQSLTHQPFEQVQTLMRTLIKKEYSGVLTLEVFNQEDFESSMKVLERCL